MIQLNVQPKSSEFTAQDAWVLGTAIALGVISSLIASVVYHKYVQKRERVCRIPLKKTCPRKCG